MAIKGGSGSTSPVALAIAIGALVLSGCSIPEPAPSLDDPVGDLVAQGVPQDHFASPESIDLRNLTALVDGPDLKVTLTVAGDVPAAPPAKKLFWLLALHTDGDAVPERDDQRVGIGYSIGFSDRGAGVFSPWLYRIKDDVGFEGNAFPGSVVVSGSQIAWTVRLNALGDPRIVRIAAWSYQIDPVPGDPRGLGDTTAQDYLPDRDEAGPARPWLVITP